jgi:DNA-directed RNA polymerase subunit F
MENCPFELSPTKDFMGQLVDTKHQAVFYLKGRAIPATMIDRLDYSLMLIHPENACAYCDEERENSKYRMKFSCFGSNYDFPITDPVFLEQFKKNPNSYRDLNDIYLVLSLGLEFEGFHFKLVATVVFPNDMNITERSQSVDVYGLSYMEQQKLRYANAYAKWTPDEDSKLLELLSKGFSTKEMAKEFERNEGAIRARIKKLTMEPSGSENGKSSDEETLAHLIELKKEIEREIEILREKINMKS